MDEFTALFSRKDMTFEEAVAYFKERVPVTASRFYQIAAEYRTLAFTVSGYTKAQVLKKFYDELLAALEEGNSLAEFRENMNDFLEAEGYEGITPYQAENIFRTNIQTAYNVGHYDGSLEDVFTGFVSGNYNGGTYANEVALKDEMLLMEETIINDTFLDTTPQELISYFLAQAGLSKMKLSSKTYPTRKMLPIRKQTAVQAINAVNAAWGLRVPFFFSGGVFYWDEKPEQKKVYTFEHGVNILNLRRAGGVWELETVSAPFIKHSHKINLIHPQVSGEVEVSKVVSKTNDSGFIRTYIYF